jgi:hypothetical protein
MNVIQCTMKETRRMIRRPTLKHLVIIGTCIPWDKLNWEMSTQLTRLYRINENMHTRDNNVPSSSQERERPSTQLQWKTAAVLLPLAMVALLITTAILLPWPLLLVV